MLLRKWFELLTQHKEDLAKLITFEAVSPSWSGDQVGGAKRDSSPHALTVIFDYELPTGLANT